MAMRGRMHASAEHSFHVPCCVVLAEFGRQRSDRRDVLAPPCPPPFLGDGIKPDLAERLDDSAARTFGSLGRHATWVSVEVPEPRPLRQGAQFLTGAEIATNLALSLDGRDVAGARWWDLLCRGHTDANQE